MKRYLLRMFPSTINLSMGIKVNTVYLIFDSSFEEYAVQRGNRYFLVKDKKSGGKEEEEISEKRFHQIWELSDKQVEKVEIKKDGVQIDFYMGEFMGISVLEVEDEVPEWIQMCVDRETTIDDRQLILRQYVVPE